MLVGDEYVEDLAQHYNTSDTNELNEAGDDFLTKSELEHLRETLKGINRPSWQRAPPSNLGEAAHGKLKADQWRTCMEFDLPVFLAQAWSSDSEPADSKNMKVRRRRKLVESTMLLAMAIRWGTSHRTSRTHADQYTKCMEGYLKTLIELYPTIDLRPSHHAALHIGECLLRFGPMHGWWMFPFERVIGHLQKYNTSNKAGECRAMQPMQAPNLRIE